MKKRSLLLVMCIMMLLVTACGKTPQEEVKEVLTKETKCESFDLGLKLDLKVEEDGTAFELNLPINLAYSDKVAKLELGENSLIGAMKLYVDNDKMYMSSKIFDLLLGVDTEKEYYIVTDIDDMSNNVEVDVDDLKFDFTTSEIEGLVDSFGKDNIVLVDKDGDVSHYRLTYTKSVLDYILTLDQFKDAKEAMDEIDVNLDDMKYSMDLYLNTKTNTFVKASLNVLDLLKEIVEVSGEEMDDDMKESLDMIKKFNITIELSGCNSTTVTVPKDVKDNAVTEDDYSEIIEDYYYNNYER